MNLKVSIQKRLRGSIYSAIPFDGIEKDEKYISIFTSKGILPNGKAFEFNHYKNGNHHIIPKNTSNILGFIKGFKTLFDHATDIENYKLANFYQALLSLKELWKSGLLISQTEFFQKISNNRSGNDSVNIETLAWITRNRPDSVKRSLESFIDNIPKTNHKHDFIVFDDSTPENYNRNKRNIEHLKKKYEIPIKLVGENERKEFVKRLSLKLEHKVPKHVIEYGLMGLSGVSHRTGANRNTFLLFTTGKYSILSDDDVFCQISKNGDDEKLTITSDASSFDTETEFFTDQNELINKVVFDYNDPISIHQLLLGHSMGSLTDKYKNQVSFTRVTPKFIYENLSSEKKVRVTMMGAAGDSGAGSPISKIFFPANKLVPLISDLENFRSKMYSRSVLQSHNSLTVGPPNFLLGMNLGFDNTELLPPFHPNFRNSDGIFASVLRKCFGNSYIGHLPYAISHIPPDERPVDDSDLITTFVRIPDVLRFSIDEFNNRAVTTEEGLKSLGIYLRDISKRTDDNLKEYLGLINTHLITSDINRMEPLYKEYKNINKQWAEFVEQRIETLYKCLQNGKFAFQFKEIADLPNENQLLTIRRVYENFGDLLYYWPEIYACVETHRKILIN
jgi:hypothetical protein